MKLRTSVIYFITAICSISARPKSDTNYLNQILSNFTSPQLDEKSRCQVVEFYRGSQEICEQHFQKCVSETFSGQNWMNSISCAVAYQYLLNFVTEDYFTEFCDHDLDCLSNFSNLEEQCLRKIYQVQTEMAETLLGETKGRSLMSQFLQQVGTRNFPEPDLGTGLGYCEKLLASRIQTKNDFIKNKLSHKVKDRRRQVCDDQFSGEDAEYCHQKYDEYENLRFKCQVEKSKNDCKLAKILELDLPQAPTKPGKEDKMLSKMSTPCGSVPNLSPTALKQCNKRLNLIKQYKLLCLQNNEEAHCQLAHILKKLYHPNKRYQDAEEHLCLNNPKYQTEEEIFECIQNYAIWRAQRKSCSEGNLEDCKNKKISKQLLGLENFPITPEQKQRKKLRKLRRIEAEEKIDQDVDSIVKDLDYSDLGSGEVDSALKNLDGLVENVGRSLVTEVGQIENADLFLDEFLPATVTSLEATTDESVFSS